MACALSVTFLASLMFSTRRTSQDVPAAGRAFYLIALRPAATVPLRPGASAAAPSRRKARLDARAPITAPAPSMIPPAPATSVEAFDSATWFSMAQALADARKGGKALGGARPALTTDRPGSRAEALAEAMASAVSPDAEPPMGARTRYTDADGRVYTSITRNGKKECFMSGPLSRSDGRSSGPLKIKCPASSAGWRKYH